MWLASLSGYEWANEVAGTEVSIKKMAVGVLDTVTTILTPQVSLIKWPYVYLINWQTGVPTKVANHFKFLDIGIDMLWKYIKCFHQSERDESQSIIQSHWEI